MEQKVFSVMSEEFTKTMIFTKIMMIWLSTKRQSKFSKPTSSTEWFN